MSNFQVKTSTILEDFETLGDWTIAGGTAVLDSTIAKSGSSLKLTSGSGTNCIATKTISVDLSLSGRHSFWVYVENVSQVSNIQVILSSSSSFAVFFTRTIAGTALHEGWNKINLSKDQWTNTGGDDWANVMVRHRVRVNAVASQSPVVYFDLWEYGGYNAAKVIISFDDGWATQFTEGYAYMRQLGFKGSLFLIKERIDTANYMTTAQVQELFDKGWDVLNHSRSHPNMATELSTQAEVEEQLTSCRDWILLNGWGRRNGENHVAYPNGGYDTKVLAAMANLKMISGRSIINRNQANVIDNTYLLTRQSHAYTATSATYKAYIDKAIADGGSVQINYHKIVADGTGAADTEVEVAQFKDLMNYIASKKAQIEVMTFLDWYGGVNNARKSA